jgi:CBS domain-containing protein
MPRDSKVSEFMTTDVLSFGVDDTVQAAMEVMVERSIDGAPVTEAGGKVVGMLSTGDLIVQESQLHFPTVISILGATLELPSSKHRFDEDVEKALGSKVRDVMHAKPHTIGPDDTLEQAATLMHDHDVSRLPVVDADGRLVGIVARVDVLRDLISPPPPAGA